MAGKISNPLVPYAAFLRGINVGGSKPITMEKLRQAFEGRGFTNVRTILASGNVLFEAPRKDASGIQAELEEVLAAQFGAPVPVMVRSLRSLRKLVQANPFKGVKLTPDIRLMVTFLGSPHGKTSRKTGPHIVRPTTDFRIVHASPMELCTVLRVGPGHGTPEFMAFVDRRFGTGATTRSWNTLLKVLDCRGVQTSPRTTRL